MENVDFTFLKVLGSQQNCEEGTDFSHMPPAPTHAQLPLPYLSTIPPQGWDICSGGGSTLAHQHHLESRVYIRAQSWCSIEGDFWGFPSGPDSKHSDCNAGDPGSIPASGRSPGDGNDNPLQYSCLENPMNRGAWWATVHGVTKSWTQLSD